MLRKNNTRLIPVCNGMSHLFAVRAALQGGEVVSMTRDRSLGSRKSVECDFGNGKADFPAGAFAPAAHFNVEALSIFAMKASAKRVQGVRKTGARQRRAGRGEAPAKRTKAERYTRAFAKEPEHIVRRYPAQRFSYYEFWKT